MIPLDGNDVLARIEDGLVVYPDAYPDTDVLYKSTPTHTDEYLLLRSADAPTTWRYRVKLGPAIVPPATRGHRGRGSRRARGPVDARERAVRRRPERDPRHR